MKNIVVIGSIYMDMVISTSVSPRFGESVKGSGFATSCGGGATLAVALAKINGSVDMIGAIGNDDFGTMLKTNLENYGVNTSGVEVVDSNSGIHMTTVYNGSGQVIEDVGANGGVTPEVIDKNIELIKRADIVVIQTDIPMKAVIYAAKRSGEFGCRVLLNPTSVVKFPDKLYEYVDTIVCNELEAHYLTCTSDTYSAMGMLKRSGVKQVVITLGSNGSIYYVYGDINKCPAFKTKVADHSGAGDAFVAAYSSAVTDEHHENHSIEFASLAASIAVSRFGCIESFPTLAEVMDRMGS
ncbi:MAG: ribokinase [Clostridia bacterium]|nr:ribokinase [Clostridia bacterium]